tara:strand:+ start:277 stop:591 length:315 start_codon:yes stop_codon:yes gene_type:complete
MAKRKTPKVDKIIDLTPEKITDSQLNRLQSTIRTVEKLTSDMGRLEVQKHSLFVVLKEHQEIIRELRNEFNKEYGTDDINIQDGTIMREPEKTTESNGETNKKD